MGECGCRGDVRRSKEVLLHTAFYDHTDCPDERREGGRDRGTEEGGEERWREGKEEEQEHKDIATYGVISTP